LSVPRIRTPRNIQLRSLGGVCPSKYHGSIVDGGVIILVIKYGSIVDEYYTIRKGGMSRQFKSSIFFYKNINRWIGGLNMKLKDIWEKMKSKIMGDPVVPVCCEDPVVVPVCCCEDPVVPEKKMVKIKKKVVKKKNNWESNRKAALKRKR
jgi:hypothetical protein